MELVTAVMVVLVLVKDIIMEDSEEVAVVNSLDQVLVEVGLEVVLQDSGHLVLLMVVEVVHIMLEPMLKHNKGVTHHLKVVDIVVTDTLK